MENPGTWKKAEKIISDILDEFERNHNQPDPIVGWSLPKRIAEALRDEGILREGE